MKCKIQNCDNPSSTRNLCKRHYERWRKYGNPLFSKYPEKGEILQYLKNHMYDGCCTPWPYTTHSGGYGKLYFKGKTMYTHQLVCTLVNGPKPKPNYEVRHLCNKGHLACFNADCLEWASRKINFRDKILNGTSPRGSNCGTAILNEKQVKQIKIALKNNVKQRILAKKYKVSESAIGFIKTGRSWCHVK
jgi:hypothetical protein